MIVFIECANDKDNKNVNKDSSNMNNLLNVTDSKNGNKSDPNATSVVADAALKANLKVDVNAADLGNVLFFKDPDSMQQLAKDIRNGVAKTKDVKYVVIVDAIAKNFKDSELSPLYAEITSLVSSGKIKAGVLFNNSMNDKFMKLPLIERGVIRIDLKSDKSTGVPNLIGSLNHDSINDKKVTNALIKSLDVLRLDYRITELDYIQPKLAKMDKIDVINSGKLYISANNATKLDELLNKCTISPEVRSVEINLVQSTLINEMIDAIMLKFPNCKMIKAARPVDKSLVEYITKNYRNVIPPSNVMFLDSKELEFLLTGLSDKDKELVRNVVRHMADVDARNHLPLLSCIRINASGLASGAQMNRSGGDDSHKCRRSLEYLLNYPIGDTKIKFDFGDAALSIHRNALIKIVEKIQPGMNHDQRNAILSYFISLLTNGTVGSSRIPFFVGPPGSGKSISIQVVGAMLGYLHWFLPGSPDKYIKPSEEDVENAIDFGIDAREKFFTILSLSSVANKAVIDGSMKVFMSADAGIMKLYCRNVEHNGKVYPLIFMGVLFDEVDKANKNGNAQGEPPVIYSLMPFATKDTKGQDLYCELNGHIHPVVSIFAGNDAPDDFEPLWNRTNKVIVPGFSNVQKRDLIFNLFKEVVSISFPNLVVFKAENGDIHVNSSLRIASGADPWIIISHDIFNTIIDVSGDDAGLRGLKDNLGSMLVALSVKSSDNLANDDHSTITVNKENIGQYLPFIVTDRKTEVFPGSAVCALGVRDRRQAIVVKCSNNENTSQMRSIMSPGPIQKNQQNFQFISANAGHDVGHLTFAGLSEIIKNPISRYKSDKYLAMSTKIKSLDNRCANNHWFIDVEYNLMDSESPRIAGTAGVISYVSKLVNKSPLGFAIGYCDSDGVFRPIGNAPEAFNLCVNKMIDLNKFDAGIHKKITVVLPRTHDGVSAYEKLGIPENLRSIIEIKEADNIFDIIGHLIPDFAEIDGIKK